MSDLNIQELRRLQANREAAHKQFDASHHISIAAGVVAGRACDDADDELKSALLENAVPLLNSHEESLRLKEENEELRKALGQAIIAGNCKLSIVVDDVLSRGYIVGAPELAKYLRAAQQEQVKP